MVKHTQTMHRQQPTNCLSVLDHFVGLVLKGLINVSSQLTELFNLSFSHGVFPLILKTSIIIPVYKRIPSAVL